MKVILTQNIRLHCSIKNEYQEVERSSGKVSLCFSLWHILFPFRAKSINSFPISIECKLCFRACDFFFLVQFIRFIILKDNNSKCSHSKLTTIYDLRNLAKMIIYFVSWLPRFWIISCWFAEVLPVSKFTLKFSIAVHLILSCWTDMNKVKCLTKNYVPIPWRLLLKNVPLYSNRFASR